MRKWYLAISPSPERRSRGGSVVERVGVADHAGGLPERSDEVLALGQVDRRLAADRGVDHRQQRRGDVDDGDAAVPHGSGESGDVGDHAPADGDDDVVASQAEPGERPRRRARRSPATCSPPRCRCRCARSGGRPSSARRHRRTGSPAWVTTATRLARGGSRSGRRSMRPGTDVHVVAAARRARDRRRCHDSWTRQRRAEGVGVADELVDGVAAELAQRLGGEDEGDHRLGDDAHRRHGGDVGALLERQRSPPSSPCRRSPAPGR